MLSSLLLLGCAGIALAKDGYVKLDFEREYVKEIRKRQVPASELDENVTLAQHRSLYWLDLTIGTPPQPFRLQLDTGSSNLWIPNSDVSVCSEDGGCPGGSYTPGDSSTYSSVQEGTFQIQYGDGTGETGDFFTDTVTVGEIRIPENIMAIGLANEVNDGPQLRNDGQGLVGVGYVWNFAGIESLATNDYIPPTIVTAMVQSGDIQRESYSLWLDSQNDGVGSIIFGGVDPTKYTGELVALQTLESYNGISNYTAFYVALTGISVKDDAGTRLLTDSSFAVPALLDSGTTLQYLPQSVFSQISGGFGVSEGFVPCSYRNAAASLIYHFGGEGGQSIEVPMSALTDLPGTTSQDSYQFDDGTAACSFNVIAENGNDVILGDSFMRSGYFVYDLENNLVAMAQGKAAVTNEAITAIPSGTSIPGCSSTNTLTIPPSAAASSLPPSSEQTSLNQGGSVLPGTPSFSLGSAASQTGGSGGAASTGGASEGAAPSLKSAGASFAMVASLAALVLVL